MPLPRFTVWNLHDPNDTRGVSALCAREAALECVERDEREACEYPITSGRGDAVYVVRDDAGNVSHWRVTGETRPAYFAQEE